jgi:hypothetical protein
MGVEKNGGKKWNIKERIEMHQIQRDPQKGISQHANPCTEFGRHAETRTGAEHK